MTDDAMPEVTVLYVEDEANDALFMRLAFSRSGLENSLRVVEDGRRALDYLMGHGSFADRKQHPMPTLVLLDLNLPLVSGFEVLQWLRQRAQFRALPVIVFSSSSRLEDKTKCRELGASDYIEKPGSGLDFVAIVSRLKLHWLAQPGVQRCPDPN